MHDTARFVILSTNNSLLSSIRLLLLVPVMTPMGGKEGPGSPVWDWPSFGGGPHLSLISLNHRDKIGLITVL